MLRARHVIPPLTLHAADGRVVRAWDFKQKKNLVIVFLHADCERCVEFLAGISAEAPSLHERNAVVLTALLEGPSRALAERVREPIIAGVDASGSAVRAFLGEDALEGGSLGRTGVFVTDRYGELFVQWDVGNGHNFPRAEKIMESLELIEMACDECNTPLWPVEE